MLEARVKIDKDLAVRGYRTALKYKAFQDLSYFYAVRLMIVWIAISVVNALWKHGEMTTPHLIALGVVWLGMSFYAYREWYNGLADKTEGWEFVARLDDDGVSTSPVDGGGQEFRYAWSHYQSYRDRGDYLQINDVNGGITFVPKTAELAELIEFTKEKIPEYGH